MTETPVDAFHSPPFLPSEEEMAKLLPHAKQAYISAHQTAKILGEMDIYKEKIHINQLAEYIAQESEKLGTAGDQNLQHLLGAQALSLNALYHFALNKFVSQKQEEGKAQDTRLLHYALTAQRQFIITADALKTRKKSRTPADPFSPYGAR